MTIQATGLSLALVDTDFSVEIFLLTRPSRLRGREGGMGAQEKKAGCQNPHVLCEEQAKLRLCKRMLWKKASVHVLRELVLCKVHTPIMSKQ